MTNFKKYAVWVCWLVYYAFTRTPKHLAAYINYLSRTRYPWQKFKPRVCRGDEPVEWNIYLENESSYVDSAWLQVELMRSQHDNRVVGFTIWGRNLQDTRACDWSGKLSPGVEILKQEP